MKYFVEITVARQDGSRSTNKTPAPSYEEARTTARLIAEEYFRDQYHVGMDFQFGTAPSFENDFGERCCIIAMAYTDAPGRTI